MTHLLLFCFLHAVHVRHNITHVPVHHHACRVYFINMNMHFYLLACDDTTCATCTSTVIIIENLPTF